jgi:hypothetical protein
MNNNYQIFISHSNIDSALASELKTLLENAFLGRIKCFVASEDITPGVNWKDVIKKKINACQAGLFLLTPNYVDSVWCTAEFSAFWAASKDVYLLSINGVKTKSLFEPIKDCQIVNISDETGLHAFIRALSRKIGVRRYPYGVVGDIVTKCPEIYRFGQKQYADKKIEELRLGKNPSNEESDRLLLLDDTQLLEALELLDKTPLLRNIIAKGVLQQRDEKVLIFAVDRLAQLDDEELEKATIRLIIKDAYQNSVFAHCIKALARNNQERLIKALKVMHSKDETLFSHYVNDEKLVTDSVLLNSLQDSFLQSDIRMG